MYVCVTECLFCTSVLWKKYIYKKLYNARISLQGWYGFCGTYTDQYFTPSGTHLYFLLDNKVKIKNLRQCSFSPLAGMLSQADIGCNNKMICIILYILYYINKIFWENIEYNHIHILLEPLWYNRKLRFRRNNIYSVRLLLSQTVVAKC